VLLRRLLGRWQALRRARQTAAAELQSHQAALAERNEQLHAIFMLCPDALRSIDARDCVRYTNDAFYRLTGLSAAELIDQPAALLEQHLSGCCAEPASVAGLAACFPADGGRCTTRLTLARPRHTVLELVGVLGRGAAAARLLYLRDITHESEVDRLKGEFLHTAAHELRTPITSIHACLELLLTREYDATRRARLLGIAQRQSQAMVTVVDELLDLARLEDRRESDLVLEDHALGTLVAQVAEDFVPPAGREPPQIDIGAGMAVVRVDRQKVSQVVRNLVSNAYKYSTQGPVRLRLLPPQTSAQGLRVGFEVEDHGIGMTAEQLARVGERFYRADASGRVLGTGLGMSIVAAIVGLMHGTLALASTPGKGTTATVWLPCVASYGADAGDHLRDAAAHAQRHQFERRMGAAEDAEQLVGETVADVGDAAEVELGAAELQQA
jgi:signal transduction histidine kinase